tara:strand:+ start:153 stop:776 length:624 start_codon:yes stop_codon:yes gene_type:complete
MNFELADKLTELIEVKKLDEAIELAEEELNKIPETDFHKIIGKNLKHLKLDLKKHIADFDQSTTNELRKKQGFFKSILGSGKKVKPLAFYCEMNGFTINYDRWYIDLFSFENYSLTDWDWLSDFYDSTVNDLTITGFEDIQKAFEKVHENKMFEEPHIDQAYEVCELLVILRLQELFRETYKDEESEWSKIPMFVTAHDYEMIYKVN